MYCIFANRIGPVFVTLKCRYVIFHRTTIFHLFSLYFVPENEALTNSAICFESSQQGAFIIISTSRIELAILMKFAVHVLV